jgi:GNAT superfamily N-acetyltransferase
MGGVADEFLVRYATECFAGKSLVLGFFEQDNLRAAGELHAPDDELTSAIAFSVVPEFRNRGIGTVVLRRLILSARNRKIQYLRMNCHGQNQAMQALARKFKADLRIDHAGTVGDIMPRAATPYSVLMEALDDAREFGKAAIDVRRRLRLHSGRKVPLVK